MKYLDDEKIFYEETAYYKYYEIDLINYTGIPVHTQAIKVNTAGINFNNQLTDFIEFLPEKIEVMIIYFDVLHPKFKHFMDALKISSQLFPKSLKYLLIKIKCPSINTAKNYIAPIKQIITEIKNLSQIYYGFYFENGWKLSDICPWSTQLKQLLS